MCIRDRLDAAGVAAVAVTPAVQVVARVDVAQSQVVVVQVAEAVALAAADREVCCYLDFAPCVVAEDVVANQPVDVKALAVAVEQDALLEAAAVAPQVVVAKAPAVAVEQDALLEAAAVAPQVVVAKAPVVAVEQDALLAAADAAEVTQVAVANLLVVAAEVANHPVDAQVPVVAVAKAYSHESDADSAADA